MRIQPITVYLLLLFVLSFAGDKKGHGDSLEHEKMMKKLGLTEEQATQLKTHFKSSKTKQKAQREKVGGLKEQLHAAFTTYPVDKAKINQLKEQWIAAKGELKAMHIDSKLFMVSMLTEEQHKKFVEWKKKHHKKKDMKMKDEGGKKSMK